MKKVGKGSGAVESAPAEKTEFSLIPPTTLETLYANLLKGRMLGQRLEQGRGPRDEGWGAVKAAAAAVLMDLRGDDVVATAEEVPLVRVLRGERAAVVVRDRKGLRGETAQTQEAEKLLLHSIGAALANRTKKNGKVAVMFWRHAALEYWQDALDMARAHLLPLILVCPASEGKDARKKATADAPGTELPRMLVDGFDAVAVYRVAHEAIDRARRDRGATLIECASICVKGKRRAREDAVVFMERYLRGKGMLRRGMRQKIEEEFAQELGGAKKKRDGS